MTSNQAIKLFHDIQNGRGTGDLRAEFAKHFGTGSFAKKHWDDPLFTLGVEYGILIAIAKTFNLNLEDIEPGR